MAYPYYGFNPYMQQYQPQTSMIRVQNEAQAREWNVAPGNSVTFVDDNAPYCYTKAMGLSQFDAPVFKRFRLVEEPPQSVQDTPQPASEPQQVNLPEYITKAEFEALQALVNDIQNQIKELTVNEPTESITES